MAEQLAENYHNTWGRKKKQELEAKGEDAHQTPTQATLLRGLLVIGSGIKRAYVRVVWLSPSTIVFTPLNLCFCICTVGVIAFSTAGLW